MSTCPPREPSSTPAVPTSSSSRAAWPARPIGSIGSAPGSAWQSCGSTVRRSSPLPSPARTTSTAASASAPASGPRSRPPSCGATRCPRDRPSQALARSCASPAWSPSAWPSGSRPPSRRCTRGPWIHPRQRVPGAGSGGSSERGASVSAAPHALGLIGDSSPGASRLLRLLRRSIGLLGRRVLRFRLELIGGENLPGDAHGPPVGGWIAAGLPHVTWIEPFVMLVLLPPEPRLTWFGDGRVIERSWWRRFVFRRIGGVVPIWPGGGPRAFGSHLEAVQRVVDAGAVFALFPEKGPPVPPGQARPLEPGLGYFALRTGALVVPIVFGGTHELFLGRRIRMVVLPPTTAPAPAGPAPHEPLPAPPPAAERETARGIVEALHARTADAVASAHLAAEPAPGTRKRWRWLTHAFR